MGPNIKPKLTRDGPDAYVTAYQFSTGEFRTIRIERDGDEWIRTDLSRPHWYPTLKAFRRKVAITNIHRWLNFGHRGEGEKSRLAARRFITFAKSYPGVRRCEGERDTIPGFGAFIRHDGCCERVGGVSLILPEGKDLLDLYQEWEGSK